MPDPDFGTICLCAMRYALGRATYMPGLVQNYIRAHIKELDSRAIQVMIRDICEADRITSHTLPSGRVIKIDGLGDTQIDRPDWLRFLEFLKEREAENADD